MNGKSCALELGLEVFSTVAPDKAIPSNQGWGKPGEREVLQWP